MRRTICLMLVGLFVALVVAIPSFAEEVKEEGELRPVEEMQIIQLRDPFEIGALEEKLQKYFSLDTTYDYQEETTSIWTTLGFRKDVFDISFTWDQQLNPSQPGTATLSFNFWW